MEWSPREWSEGNVLWDNIIGMGERAGIPRSCCLGGLEFPLDLVERKQRQVKQESLIGRFTCFARER